MEVMIGRQVIFFIFLFAFILGIFYLFQQRLLFSPMRRHVMVPEDPHIDTFAGDVHIWHFDKFNTKPDAKTVLFCHGNNGNISYRSYCISLCKHQGMNLCLFDYRGYGKSRGIPSTSGVVRDGLAAYDYLATKVPQNSIVVWGESLGGAVSTRIAAARQCHALILWATFSALDDMIKDHNEFSRVAHFVGRMSGTFFDAMPSHKHVKKVQCKVAVVHSRFDELIPLENSLKMYESISHSNKLHLTIKGTHAKSLIEPEQLCQLFTFCDLPNQGCDEACRILEYYHRIYPGKLVETPEEYKAALGLA